MSSCPSLERFPLGSSWPGEQIADVVLRAQIQIVLINSGQSGE